MKWNSIFVDENDFITKVKDPIKAIITAEWVDDAKMFTSWDRLWQLFNLRYEEVETRFSSEKSFLSNFKLRMIDGLLPLYVHQLSLINDNLSLLKDPAETGKGAQVTNNNATSNIGTAEQGIKWDINKDTAYQKIADITSSLNENQILQLNRLNSVKINDLAVTFIDSFVDLFQMIEDAAEQRINNGIGYYNEQFFPDDWKHYLVDNGTWRQDSASGQITILSKPFWNITTYGSTNNLTDEYIEIFATAIQTGGYVHQVNDGELWILQIWDKAAKTITFYNPKYQPKTVTVGEELGETTKIVRPI